LTHCDTAFAKWQLPDEILFVDAIPLTSTGKMDKKVVRADLESKGYQLPSLRSESAG
jgi:fatty-acyl-CoA synthase